MMLNRIKDGAIITGLAAVISFVGCSTPSQNAPEAHEKRALASFSQEITSPVHEFQIKTGGVYTLDIEVKNTGTEPWFRGDGPLFVNAGYRWHDSTGAVLPLEGTRAQLTRSVIPPGETDSLKLQVLAQPKPGSYTLWISMVQEQVAWFFDKGASPLILHVTIT